MFGRVGPGFFILFFFLGGGQFLQLPGRFRCHTVIPEKTGGFQSSQKTSTGGSWNPALVDLLRGCLELFVLGILLKCLPTTNSLGFGVYIFLESWPQNVFSKHGSMENGGIF